MDATKARRRARTAKAAGPARPPRERARARAYLDLWERQPRPRRAPRPRPRAGARPRRRRDGGGGAPPRRRAQPADPPPRRGPFRPTRQALLAAPRADSPDFPWVASLGVDRAALADLDQLEVAREIAARLGATDRRAGDLAAPPLHHTLRIRRQSGQAGCSRLLDYGGAPGAARPEGRRPGVPSLINRPYILDLAPGRSMLRWLAAQGLRPLLMEWGTPGRRRRGSTSTPTARHHLDAGARPGATGIAGRPVPVVGYCMGGALAVGLAADMPEDGGALATIGAPWGLRLNPRASPAATGPGHPRRGGRRAPRALLDPLRPRPSAWSRSRSSSSSSRW